MHIEDIINIEANKMLDRYYPHYIKKYPRNKYQVKAKYFKYFENAAKLFCVRDNYNAEKLVDAFVADGFMWPAQLPNEFTWNKYLNYLPGLKDKKSEETEIVEKIVESSILIKRAGSVSNWLNDYNKLTIKNNQMKIDPTLFSFSKTFCDFADDYIDTEEYRKKVFRLNCKNKLLEKIKALLGDDYIGEN